MSDKNSNPKIKTDSDQPQSRDIPVGTRLKQARESKELSLESVHEATKIPLDALRAIEEGYTVRTMSPFYYRGFVKIYGQCLDVDVSDVDALRKPKDITGKNSEQEYREFFIRDLLSNIFTTRRIKQAILLGSGLLGLFLLFHAIKWIFHRPVKPSAVITQTSKTEKPKVVVRPPIEKAAEERKEKQNQKKLEARTTPPVSKPVLTRTSGGSTAAVAKEPVVSKMTKKVMLTVRARKESWLRVKVDGQVVFQSTLETGVVETWLADETITISGQNIHQLEFELNGKMIGPLGRKDRKAKTIVVTPDGLTVTK